MIQKILIANRGEIACRIIKTARQMGIASVAVCSDADINALHTKMADETVNIGAPPANKSYLEIDNIMQAIAETSADAVHPGYGFLSENRDFADRLSAKNIKFIGPPADAIQAMGDKILSKKIAKDANVNVIPGHMGLIENADEAVKIATKIGYPVMIKASAGGGGKGMRIAYDSKQTREGFQSAKNEAINSFGDGRIFIEKFISQPRHIEIQILADAYGNYVYLGERECSIQRRNQKVIEETPSLFINDKTRKAMGEQACALAKSVKYQSAGTVEFVVDSQQNFYFLEMNTRLQVEHPVTELVTNIDLVEQMINIANGEKLTFTQSDIKPKGWAIESRLYAEDPYNNFLPSIGRLTRYRPPNIAQIQTNFQENISNKSIIRNDTGVYEGAEISRYYDPMIAKLCTWAPERKQAITAMKAALDCFEIEGIAHNVPFLSAIMDNARFISANITTAFIDEEYPDGFLGVTPTQEQLYQLAAIAAFIASIADKRAKQISNQLGQPRTARKNWVIHIGAKTYVLHAETDNEQGVFTFDNNMTAQLSSIWKPGDRLGYFTYHEEHKKREILAVKITPLKLGYRLQMSGISEEIWALTPYESKLSNHMLQKAPPDMSNMLLCPMPGLMVEIMPAQGDCVLAGHALCIVEAMKMENILRAEKDVIIKKINIRAGDTLGIGDVIMEFE